MNKRTHYNKYEIFSKAKTYKAIKRQCMRKKVYLTIKHVEAVKKHLHKKHNKPLYHYSCPFCGYFHLTSKKRNENQPVTSS